MHPVTRLLALLSNRSRLIAIDTAIVALMNAGTVVVGSRGLDSSAVTSFAMVLLICTSAVALNRATLLAPAFAAQRSEGKTVIPVWWTLIGSVPLAGGGVVLCVASGIVPFSPAIVLTVGALIIVMVAADVMRSRLIASESPARALAGDACAGSAALAGLLAVPGTGALRPLGVLLVAYLFGLLIAFGATRTARSDGSSRPAALRPTLRLGKWSGADSAMSILANILPLLTATAVLGTDEAGIYRVLQAALGPINIVLTTVVTATAIDAWRYNEASRIAELRRGAARRSGLFVLGAAAYLGIAEAVVVFVSGLRSESLPRIAVVVFVYGLVTAATVQFQAVALALGQQRFGVWIRVAVVSVSVVVSLVPGVAARVPWQDPVGITSLFAGVATFLGWLAAFVVSTRPETLAGATTARPRLR